MPGVGAELLAHVLDHVAGGAADRGHAHRAEQIRQQRAEQQADDHVRVLQAEIDGQAGEEFAQVGGVGGEQHQRGEAGRADRIALGHRLGGVADRIERVGLGANAVVEPGHFGDSAGIVGHRPVGVERDDHPGQRQHRGRGEGDAHQPGEAVGDDDPGADHQRRQRGRFEADREALDDVGAVAGLRRLGDRAHRAIIGAGIIFGDPDDEAGDDEAEQHAPDTGPCR